MAPGIFENASVNGGGTDERTAAGSERYNVEDIVLHDPREFEPFKFLLFFIFCVWLLTEWTEQKRLRIAMIGGGVSGIMMAYKVQKVGVCMTMA